MPIHILLIDDDPELCRVKKAQLELEGVFSVTVAGDTVRGLRLAKNKKPDLILLDVLMPDKDGFEVLKVLKNDVATAEIPVVMFTGVDEDEARLRAAEFYGEGYVTKAVDGPTLINSILLVLSKRAKRKPN